MTASKQTRQQGLNYRPRTYFLIDSTKAVLARIKGKNRRAAVRKLGLAHADADMAAESLSEDDRQDVGRVHPSWMGGEYLPNLDAEEVEIARIELESVTGDVISLRARRADGTIHYRLVDEYDTAYPISPASSEHPLTFGELVRLINPIQGDILECNLEYRVRASEIDRMEHFIHVSSEYYPQLAGYFQAQTTGRVARERELALIGQGFPELCVALHGSWEVTYPGTDDKFQDDHIETLTLKEDGTYTWSPPPAWAKRKGQWKVEDLTRASIYRLGFEDKSGGVHWNYLVFNTGGKEGRWFWNWTSTPRNRVVLTDLIFKATRPNAEYP